MTLDERKKVTKHLWHKHLIQLAKERARTGWCVADAGCGETGLLERLWKLEWPPNSGPVIGIGVDKDQKSIDRCYERARESRLPLIYFKAGLDNLDFLSGVRCDVIFCWEVMYLLDDEELTNAIKFLRLLLARGGVLLAGTLSRRREPDEIIDPYCAAAQKHISKVWNPRWRLEADYVALLKHQGFQVEQQRITVSPEDYATFLKDIPAVELYFQDEAHKRTYYTEVGKPVWLCTYQ